MAADTPQMAADGGLAAFARDLLHDLRTRFGLDQWVLTRVVGGDAMVIFTDGDMGLAEGMTIPWGGSLEARLVDGGPLVAADVSRGHYADATPPVPGVRGFIGAAVHTADGALFGALYGIGRSPTRWTEADVALPLSLAGRALRVMLQGGEVRAALGPTARSSPPAAPRDPLTGLPDRRAFEEALAAEEARCRRHGTHATALCVAVGGALVGDGAGSAGPATVDPQVVVRQAGDALRAWRRAADVVAHTHPAAFTCLLVQAWEDDVAAAVRRLRETMAARRLAVTIGVADNRSRSLVEAVDVARARAGVES